MGDSTAARLARQDSSGAGSRPHISSPAGCGVLSKAAHGEQCPRLPPCSTCAEAKSTDPKAAPETWAPHKRDPGLKAPGQSEQTSRAPCPPCPSCQAASRQSGHGRARRVQPWVTDRGIHPNSAPIANVPTGFSSLDNGQPELCISVGESAPWRALLRGTPHRWQKQPGLCFLQLLCIGAVGQPPEGRWRTQAAAAAERCCARAAAQRGRPSASRAAGAYRADTGGGRARRSVRLHRCLVSCMRRCRGAQSRCSSSRSWCDLRRVACEFACLLRRYLTANTFHSEHVRTLPKAAVEQA